MSKAALNMGVACLANVYPDLRWLLMQPGYVLTKMNKNEANLPTTDIDVAMEGVLRVAMQAKLGVSFYDYAGVEQSF
jgi:NAD(P)-dependent dehydrogenase (short-subunit alcohol dehydrogenase family)